MRHPNKVAWLIHQHRAAYELCGTIYSDFSHVEPDVGPARDADSARHAKCCGECRRIFTNARNTAARLTKFNGLPPSRCIIRRGSPRGSQPGPYGDYVLSVGRLESVKRVDLIVARHDGGRPSRFAWSSPATERSARTSSA